MPFNLQQLFAEYNEYRFCHSHYASLKRAGECYGFLLEREPAYRAIEALLEDEETIELGFHLPEHFTIHLKFINKERMAKIAEAFDVHFGPIKTDESELYGNTATRKFVGRKAPRTSFWNFTLTLSFLGEACTPVYEDVEVPATTQRRLVKLECPDGPAVRGSEGEAEDEPIEPSLIPLPSGDEDQPRRDNEVPF